MQDPTHSGLVFIWKGLYRHTMEPNCGDMPPCIQRGGDLGYSGKMSGEVFRVFWRGIQLGSQR